MKLQPEAASLSGTVLPERTSRAYRWSSWPPAIRSTPPIRWGALAVFALLGLHATMAWTASLHKGLSFDEGLQLAVGYNLWHNHDFRIEGANGDLIKRWATLPYLISRPNFVGTDDLFWQKGVPYELAFRFFFEIGNWPESLLQQARAMVTLLSVATGLLVFRCSRDVFGLAGGLVSVALFAFSPHMLAFGGIVSTDMSIVLTLFGSTWCVWRLLHEVNATRLALSTGFIALLVLAKPTALTIFPVTAVMLAVKLIHGAPLILRWHMTRRVLAKRWAQASVFSILVAVHALAGWLAIWTHYEWRYAASPQPANPALNLYQHSEPDSTAGPVTGILNWVAETHFLPEGYHHGLELLAGNDDEIGSFMNGRWKIGGTPLFFPYAIWVKTQPVLFVLLLLGGALAWRSRRRKNVSTTDSNYGSARSRWYELTPFLALTACYVAIAAIEDLNIGHRHILPIYPCLYVLAGAAGFAWQQHRFRLKAAVGVALAWLAVDSFAMRPHYLAYFGPQAGGPEKGYRHLVDSSLDWGMNLPSLRRWLDQNNPDGREPLFLAYFGTDSPSYHGIESQRLPGFFDRREVEPYALTPGYYAISVTLLQSVYTMAFGAWSKAYEDRYQIARHNMQILEATANDARRHAELMRNTPAGFWREEFSTYDHLRFGRLCAWLRHRAEPLHHIGHTILIWKLTPANLDAALNGPPVELTNDPLPQRQFRRYYPLKD
jgi:hypothetical protein